MADSLQSTPQVPTSGQLSQLATLQAAVATARTNYHGNVAATKTAHAALVAAQKAATDYAAYIYGGTSARPYALDEGNTALV